jgi:hypothetical protein
VSFALTDGVVIGANGKRHSVRNHLRASGRERVFDTCVPELTAAGAMRTATAGRAEVRLIRAGRKAAVLYQLRLEGRSIERPYGVDPARDRHYHGELVLLLNVQDDPLYLLGAEARDGFRG